MKAGRRGSLGWVLLLGTMAVLLKMQTGINQSLCYSRGRSMKHCLCN